jgi:hypothetical protein
MKLPKSVSGHKFSSRLAQPHRPGEIKDINACFVCETLSQRISNPYYLHLTCLQAIFCCQSLCKTDDAAIADKRSYLRPNNLDESIACKALLLQPPL